MVSTSFALALCGLLQLTSVAFGQRQAAQAPNPIMDAELPLRVENEKRAPKLWPNAKVPYKFSSSIVDESKIRLIGQVIRDIESNTCLKFVRARQEPEYVNIQADRVACSSQVGMQTGATQLMLADACWDYATIAVQLLHSLGLYHENNRADRDQFVEINLENLRGLNARKFEKLTEAQFPVLSVPYDLQSITHFPNQIHGIKKGRGDWTIRSKKEPSRELGNNRISTGDYRKLKLLYNC